jgi:hypothetical protein
MKGPHAKGAGDGARRAMLHVSLHKPNTERLFRVKQ